MPEEIPVAENMFLLKTDAFLLVLVAAGASFVQDVFSWKTDDGTKFTQGVLQAYMQARDFCTTSYWL